MGILHKFKITEISAVDRPAQQHAKVLIMKSAPEIEDAKQDYVKPGPEHIGPAHAELHALATSAVRAKPGLGYNRAVANLYELKPGLRARVERELLAHERANAGGQRNGTMKIDFAKMMPSDDALEFKKHYDAGDFDSISKSEWHALIEKRAAQIRESGETSEQAFTRLITADPAGRLMFKAYQSCEVRALARRVFGKAAPGFFDKPAAGWSDTKGPTDAEQDFVPAESEMRSLAARHHAANPHLTFEQSYTEMFVHLANRDLAARVRAESIGRAQMLSPAYAR